MTNVVIISQQYKPRFGHLTVFNSKYAPSFVGLLELFITIIWQPCDKGQGGDKANYMPFLEVTLGSCPRNLKDECSTRT